MKNWKRELKPVLVALGLVFVVRTVVAEPYRVPTGSMVPTLLVGDQLIGAKFAYGFSKYALPIGQLPDFSGRLFDRQAAHPSRFGYHRDQRARAGSVRGPAVVGWYD